MATIYIFVPACHVWDSISNPYDVLFFSGTQKQNLWGISIYHYTIQHYFILTKKQTKKINVCQDFWSYTIFFTNILHVSSTLVKLIYISYIQKWSCDCVITEHNTQFLKSWTQMWARYYCTKALILRILLKSRFFIGLFGAWQFVCK